MRIMENTNRVESDKKKKHDIEEDEGVEDV